MDESSRRVAYSVLDSPGLTYHHASMQIVEDGPQRCRFVWTTDFLPAESAPAIRPVIEAGTKALKANLETPSRSPGRGAGLTCTNPSHSSHSNRLRKKC